MTFLLIFQAYDKNIVIASSMPYYCNYIFLSTKILAFYGKNDETMNFAFNLLLSNCFLRQHNGKICAIPVTYSALSQLTQRFVYNHSV